MVGWFTGSVLVAWFTEGCDLSGDEPATGACLGPLEPHADLVALATTAHGDLDHFVLVVAPVGVAVEGFAHDLVDQVELPVTVKRAEDGSPDCEQRVIMAHRVLSA